MNDHNQALDSNFGKKSDTSESLEQRTKNSNWIKFELQGENKTLRSPESTTNLFRFFKCPILN